MSKSVEFAPWLGVFETLRVVNGVPLFVREHLRELHRAMETIGIEAEFDVEKARAELPTLSGRWRWIVTPEGARTQFVEEDIVSPESVEISVSPVRVGSCNWDARFKTLSYLAHAQAWKIKSTDEVVLLNEYGLVASAARSNIFWSVKDQIFTPAHECGCRRGVTRNFVSKVHNVRSGHFPSSDLLEADEIFLTNSLRGIVSVHAVKGRTYRRTSVADKIRAAYEEEIAEQIAAGKRSLPQPASRPDVA